MQKNETKMSPTITIENGHGRKIKNQFIKLRNDFNSHVQSC